MTRAIKRLTCLVLSVLTVFSVCVTSVSADTLQESMNIYGIYLTKEGDASLLESNGKWLLIDTGVEENSQELIAKLNFYGITELDVLISHLHYDHTDGLLGLANSDIKINKLYLPDTSLTIYDTATESKINKLKEYVTINNSDVIIEHLTVGDSFSVGNTGASVIGPVSTVTPDDFEPEPDDPRAQLDHYINNRSLVVKFVCGATSFLTAGDIEKEEESALVEKYKGTDTLDADILKLSHHATTTSTTEEFLAAVTPKYSYALNSNKGYENSEYRIYYTACKNASKYGPVYLVGDETQDFRASVSQNRIKIYKGSNELTGLVTLAGGDGTKVKSYKYYIAENGVKEGVYTIGGKKYYIFTGGLVNAATYSFKLGTYIYKYEPIKGGAVRYFDTNGVMYTGFKKADGYERYFDTNTGIMVRGKDDKFNPVKIGDKYYGINTNGVIYNRGKTSGAWKKYTFSDGSYNYRYFDKDGVMKMGWLTIGSKKYYLNKSTGYRTLGLKKISKKYYYFVEKNSAGYAYNSGWKKFSKNYRYFGNDGVMKTGWLTVKGKKYYLNKDTGYRTLGFKKISKKYYYFVEKNNAGYAYSSGWKKFGKKYRYFGNDSVMKTGWLTVKGKKYYLNKDTGYRTLGLKKISGKYYYFVESKKAAYMYKGWKKFGSKKRYFNSKGYMVTGTKKIGGKKYKFDKNGYLKK